MTDAALLPGCFQLGEFPRNLFTDSSYFALLQRPLDALRQLTEVEPAAFRCPIRRLPLQEGQREFLAEDFLQGGHPYPLVHPRPEGRDRQLQWHVELEPWRGSLFQRFSNPLERDRQVAGRLLGRCCEWRRKAHTEHKQPENGEHRRPVEGCHPRG